ncbi:MAG TPA: NAD(P)-binding domain-containing protein [Longimicrobiales bacterium]|nr:NAD(P)-binding domain-containing protein [Longimicrobiales bacterium]
MNPVCIVGAGPAGLSAAVALERRGLPYRILDAGRRPGGIWDIDRDDTPMYESAHFISSKTLSGFPDFPMPASYPDYPRHDRILDYIEAYARHHDLERHITFGVTVTRARPAASSGPAPSWDVTWRDEAGTDTTGRFSGLVVATGVTWHPNLPEIPGTFDGEIRHAQSYRSPDEFRGRRVVIVGGGNSGVDIACDAARSADRAFLSLRRGYHFVPKYVFGTPSDVFAHSGPSLPAWLERPLFGFLLNRVLVGDLTRYGLPKPDHPILASHPIMNTQVLHYLGHGDLTAKPDVTRLDGREVVFEDGSREEVDLVLLATGYRRDVPFLEQGTFTGPDDLYLMLLHRAQPSLSLMGIFETDGAAYELFAEQAEVAAGTLTRLLEGGRSATPILERIATDRPDLRGGRRYVESRRHDFYVTDHHYRKALSAFGWVLDRTD